jgi:phosphoribosylaminoimidazole-succinocarboxamide synthase
VSDAVLTTECPELKLIHRGKVRDMYEIPGHEDTLLMVATDRISAYDVVMAEPIAGKGKVLTRISLFWFGLLGDIVPNHLISADVNDFPKICQPYRSQLEGRSMWVKRAKVVPIECIVRGYLSGSFWSAYKKDTTVCGF